MDGCNEVSDYAQLCYVSLLYCKSVEILLTAHEQEKNDHVVENVLGASC